MLFLCCFPAEASQIGVKILHAEYCDLDDDGRMDDVYAEVLLKMYEGVNYLTIDASLYFHGNLLYKIFRDNHVHTVTEVLYKLYYINVANESGWYVLKVIFDVLNDGKVKHMVDAIAFDPPGGDGDYPPGGGLLPGP